MAIPPHFIISYNAGSLWHAFMEHIQISIALTFGGLASVTVILSSGEPAKEAYINAVLAL